MKENISELILGVHPDNRDTRIVAVDGFGGSGKSELARRLAARLGNASIVHTDDFAVPGHEWDAEWDWRRLQRDVLVPLSTDTAGRYQRSDWDEHKLAEWHDVSVGGSLIVEGVGALREELGNYWDFAIWINTPYDVRLERGIARDGDAMRSLWTDNWMPKEQAYFEAQRPDNKADVIVDGTTPFRI